MEEVAIGVESGRRERGELAIEPAKERLVGADDLAGGGVGRGDLVADRPETVLLDQDMFARLLDPISRLDVASALG